MPDIPDPPSTPRPRVRPLPDALIDQIAAGEVVERPASVVKELVENALDAGAQRIRVEIRDGGRAWIACSDDGWGMDPTDLRLALQRHATSKIRSAEDLARIGSFGFRGEALPAIASVARVRLRSRPAEAESAWQIDCAQGRVLDERAAAGAIGTRIEVADLFAQIPARRKFLKSAQTEWGHVIEGLGQIALARPDVHFEVQRDDRQAVNWPATPDPLERIAAVLGEESAAGLIAVEHVEGPARLHGYTSRPDRDRPTQAGIRFYVNRRPVRDRLLRHALLEVYRDILPRGRFPTALLFLEVPLGSVDVNVHPAKTEVRFEDPQWMHRLVRHGIRAAISQRGWIEPGAPARSPAAASSRGAGAPAEGAIEAHSAPGIRQGDWIFADSAPQEAQALQRVPALGEGEAGEFRRSTPIRYAERRCLGQLLSTYLLLEGREGLLLVDQHAAHERVLYEGLRAQWRSARAESQALLAPLVISLEATVLQPLLDAAPQLERIGFEIEAFGADALALRSVPALLAERDPAQLVRDLADEWQAAGPAARLDREGGRMLAVLDRCFANLACHSARRKGERLDPGEQQALIEALDGIPWAPTCPHGRPVVVPIELAEIERRFGRR